MSLLRDIYRSGKRTVLHPVRTARGADLAHFSAGLERLQRAVLPSGRIEDFAVGWNRIVTGQIGATNTYTGQQNPTFREAYDDTDRTFHGFLPAGTANPLTSWTKKHRDDIADFFQDAGKWVLVAGAVVAAVALGGKK